MRARTRDEKADDLGANSGADSRGIEVAPCLRRRFPHPRPLSRKGPEGRGETEQRSNRATRFRPGQSGNPRGRPKRARGLAALVDRVLDEKVEATENGKSRRMTKRVAAMKQLVNRAVKGDHRATQLVVALIRDDQGPPAPPAPEQLGEADAMVVAELVRRIRSSAP